MTFRTTFPLPDTGIFYRVNSTHYFLPTVDVEEDVTVTKGDKLPLSCMFDIWFGMKEETNEKIGYFISSSFSVQEKGGIIIASLNKGLGKAKEVEVLLKTPQLIVYHFPNRGTMAISPKIGESVSVVLEEQ